MSVEMLDQVYGHHHPDHLRTAAQALSYGRRRQSLAETLAGHHTRRALSSEHAEKRGGGCSRMRTRLQSAILNNREKYRESERLDPQMSMQ